MAGSVSPARDVALGVIRAVTEDDAYANLRLPAEISRAGLDERDAGLATELTYGTLRQLGTLDAIIEAASGREVASIDAPVLDVLRLCAHQILNMRTASHAAVNEAVMQVRRDIGERPVAFTNGVLRAISRRDRAEWFGAVLTGDDADARLGLRHAHPAWVVSALREALVAEGRESELAELLEADNIAPRVSMVALPGLAKRPAGALTDPLPHSPLGFTLRSGAPGPLVERSGGRLRVQDEGSQLVTLALTRATKVSAGERWADVCAGPGGKTALLGAEALVAGASVAANEIVPHRATLVRQAVRPVAKAVTVSTADGRDFLQEHSGEFDRILVDAPCTGLGALRRRPEARWRKDPSDVEELSVLQRALLRSAVEAVAPGGIVAYVTCSPHLAETSHIVDAVASHDSEIEVLDAVAAISAVSDRDLDLVGHGVDARYAQLWPHRHGTDAMFLALLRRRR